MKFLSKATIIFLTIIIVAILVVSLYFFKFFNKDINYGRDDYDKSLPSISFMNGDYEINEMRAYINKDSLIRNIKNEAVVSSDKNLKIRIKNIDGNSNISVLYEIRSSENNNLIDKNNLIINPDDKNNMIAQVPILDMFDKDKNYIIVFTLSKDDDETAYYGINLNFNDDKLANEMIDLACRFSANNFDYNSARNNIVNLETNPDYENFSLADVSLKNDFNKLIYNNLKLSPLGDKSVSLNSYDGYKCDVSVSFTVKEDNDNLYRINESFTMRKGDGRIFILDYARSMSSIIESLYTDYSGINLGIKDEDKFKIYNSDDGYIICDDNGLYKYSSSSNSMLKIYPDYDCIDDLYKNDYVIKYLKSDNEGINFIVYGYFNRGKHSGQTGLIYMSYIDGKLIENNFVEINDNVEDIKSDISKLSYKSDDLYYMLGDSVYKLSADKDKNTRYITNMDKKQICVFGDSGNTFIAYKRNNKGSIYISSLDNSKPEIMDSKYDNFDIVGYINEDIVLANVYDNINKKIYDNIILLDKDGNEILTYSKDGMYIGDIRTYENIISFNLLRRRANLYDYADKDTIISKSVDSKPVYKCDIVDKYGKVCTINNGIKNIEYDFVRGHSVKEANKISIENINRDKNSYKVYHGDVCILNTLDLSDACLRAYSCMGRICFNNKEIYSRAKQRYEYSIKNKSEFNFDDNYVSVSGVELENIFGFVSNDKPVYVKLFDGNDLFIYGYDLYNISVYYPNNGTSTKIGLNDAKALFANTHNDFWVSVE